VSAGRGRPPGRADAPPRGSKAERSPNRSRRPAPSLLDAAAALVDALLAFAKPMETVLAEAVRNADGGRLGPRERRLLGDIAYEVIRRLGFLRHVAAALDPPAARGPALARRLVLLAWPPEQRPALEALLPDDERAWLLQADAVQGAQAGGALPDEARLDLPPWIVVRLLPALGEDGLRAWVDATVRPAPVDLRVNRLKATREAVQAALAEAGVESAPTPYSPIGLRLAGRPDLARIPALLEGLADVQDEGSQLLALAVGARRGETVVDFCAGAGGKTLALGAQMRATGRVLAFDVSGSRLAALAPRLATSGLANVHTSVLSSLDDERLARLAGKADRVLVDAPCTGLGTLRRHPDLKWRHTPATLGSLVSEQRHILSAAARLVKPGGTLVYATCSVLPHENEAVTAAFDEREGHAAGFTRASPLAELERAGVERAGELLDGDDLVLRTERHGTDGFRAVVWRKA
jgi:16S rRNA (cytosine967-C5)-methyltransferase